MSMSIWATPSIVAGAIFYASSGASAPFYGIACNSTSVWYRYGFSSTATDVTLNTSLSTGTRYLLVMSYESTTNTITGYINTSRDSVVETPVNTGTPTGWSIGRYGGYNGDYFNGSVIDARIYSHALTQGEVGLMNSLGPNNVSLPPCSIISCL